MRGVDIVKVFRSRKRIRVKDVNGERLVLFRRGDRVVVLRREEWIEVEKRIRRKFRGDEKRRMLRIIYSKAREVVVKEGVVIIPSSLLKGDQ